MLLARGVIPRHPPGQHRLERFRGDRALEPHLPDGRFEHAEGQPGIAIGLLRDRPEDLVRRFHILRSQAAGPVRQRPAEKHHEILFRQWREHEHPAAGEQRAVQAETRVLGRRADQRHRPALHMREERVLLSPIEPMDLVAEKHRPPSHDQPRFRLLDDLPDPRHPFGHRAEPHELALGVLGNQPGQRGLAGPRRAPQDGAAKIAAPDGIA